MKFLGTLAFGFSTIAAMIAALLSFGFNVKVEGPINPQQVAQGQQLNQCTTALAQAEQQVAEAQGKVVSLETRLRDSVGLAEVAVARVSADINRRLAVASETSAAAGTTTSVISGVGMGLLMLPLGYLLGRSRRPQPLPALTGRIVEGVVVDQPREPVAALPLFGAPRQPLSRGRVLR